MADVWVVVPGYNEAAWIGSTIDSLAAQDIAGEITVPGRSVILA